MALPADIQKTVRDAIATAKAKIPELEADINKAQAAGLDTSAYFQQLSQFKDQLRKLEAQYGSS